MRTWLPWQPASTPADPPTVRIKHGISKSILLVLGGMTKQPLQKV